MAAFDNKSLANSALSLFETLGYKSSKRLPLKPNSPENFLTTFVGSHTFNKESALFAEWQSIDFIFQLTDDEINAALNSPKKLFSSEGVYNGAAINSYLFFALDLKGASYSRTALANITRAINKLFPMPGLILFRHGETLTLSIINRRLHKKDGSKDVLEKVTLIKDICFAQPHRAHLEILFDLSFSKLCEQSPVSNFVELQNAWQKVLDTKELNKRFYRDIANWYFWAIQNVYFPGAGIEADKRGLFRKSEKVREHNAKNLIRLLTRILFVWFIKERGLIPEELFDERCLSSELLLGFDPKKNQDVSSKTQDSVYYRAVLQNLFFATLNQIVGKREFRKPNQHKNVTTLMRYESYFKNPNKFLKLVEAVVPFMNGGLFDCLDRPMKNQKGRGGGDIILYEDGFSDRPENDLCVPDFIFFGKPESVNLTAEFGPAGNNAEVKGLIHILKSYKFTIAENTPIEEDIALDPELLGRVFENLLASYNPETKVTARKMTGSFYTPREIVDYMVDESLISYLKHKLTLNGFENREAHIRELISYSVASNPFSNIETNLLIDAVDNCKIIDPACGSGAFPMGILHKLTHILHKLDPQNELWKQKQIKKAQIIDDISIRDQLIEDIEIAFKENELDYGRKLYLIENCIYGVDIQPIATQISRLRFFISLIVDQKVVKAKENFGVRPLPNLETKFVAANTLFSLEKPKGQLNLFDDKAVYELEERLKSVRHRLFSAKTPATKRKLREEDQVLREKMTEILVVNGWGDEAAKQLAAWDPYDQNRFSPFFESEWMFGLESGFDICIGNPPYVFARSGESKGLTEVEKAHFYKNYSLAEYQINLYPLFIERGTKLLNDHGTLSFITPNNWLTINTNSLLRKFVLERAECVLVNFFARVFESAAVDSCIVVYRKTGSNNILKLFEYSDSLELVREVPSSHFLQQSSYIININSFKNTDVKELLSKIETQSVKLSSVATVKAGLKAYEVGKGKPPQTEEMKTNRVYHSNSKEDENYIKYLDGKNVIRYLISWGGEYLKYGSNLAAPRKDFNLFSTKRILVRQIPAKPPYCVHACLLEEVFLNDLNSMNIINVLESPEAILGILNSRLTSFWFVHKFGKMQRGTFPQFKVNELEEFPLPINRKTKERELAEMVKKILQGKQNKEDTSHLEKSIDSMVYSLYNLTPEEIKAVES